VVVAGVVVVGAEVVVAGAVVVAAVAPVVLAPPPAVVVVSPPSVPHAARIRERAAIEARRRRVNVPCLMFR
jgi:hypothetical protein